MTARQIRISHLTRASGLSRHFILRLEQGLAQPSVPTIKALVDGARIVTNDPSIKANDLFPLDDDELHLEKP